MNVYLLRHGEVESHRGDVPITSGAQQHSYEVGRALARRDPGPVLVLNGDTRRASETATHLARGAADAGIVIRGPRVAFALRNPDLYLGGARVDMVSSLDAFAAQVDGLSPRDVEALPFFPEFIASADRIGWWLTHESPPGEDATSLAARVKSFAVSLMDPVPGRPEVVVAVTHSPLVRAVGLDLLGRDIGEPPWVSGLLLVIGPARSVTAEVFQGSDE